jgi:hypothetical protein
MSDGLRNELKITVDSTGAIGGPGGGASDAAPWPVARRGQLELSPFQAASNFAADSQLRFTREMAMEISRDRQSAREVQEALMRRDVLEELDLSSARRAKAMERRNALLASVRRRGELDTDDGFGRRMDSRARSFARGTIRDASRGLLASAMASTIMPEGDGITGSLSRIGADVAVGATYGGKAGAAVALIWSSIRELRTLVSQIDKSAQERRDSDAKARQKVDDALHDLHAELAQIKADADRDFTHMVTVAVDRATIQSYRQSRYTSFDLVP